MLPAMLANPPRVTKATFRRGDVHPGVWALQRFLNVVYKGRATPLDEDGWFGAGTENLVKRYQADVSASVDGIVGQQTQQRMVRSCVVRAPHGSDTPRGLIEGQINGESGGYFAAVNAQVAGGLDLGLTQRRVYGPPFDPAKVAAAFDPVGSVAWSVKELYDRAETYGVGRHSACPFNRWELAVLHHNWPYAAGKYHRYGRLPYPNKVATWAPEGVPDSAKTWDGWAHFYVEQMTKGVTF
jgi:hypothetical protein